VKKTRSELEQSANASLRIKPAMKIATRAIIRMAICEPNCSLSSLAFKVLRRPPSSNSMMMKKMSVTTPNSLLVQEATTERRVKMNLKAMFLAILHLRTQ